MEGKNGILGVKKIQAGRRKSESTEPSLWGNDASCNQVSARWQFVLEFSPIYSALREKAKREFLSSESTVSYLRLT